MISNGMKMHEENNARSYLFIYITREVKDLFCVLFEQVMAVFRPHHNDNSGFNAGNIHNKRFTPRDPSVPKPISTISTTNSTQK